MRKKFLQIISTISLALVLFVLPCMATLLDSNATKEVTQQTRTIETSNDLVDYESILNEFENSKLETEGLLTTFEGVQKYNLQDFVDIDEVNNTDIQNEEFSVKYQFSYDLETNLVTLTAILMDGTDAILIDNVIGEAFINEMGNIDAILEVEGEYVLLSELQDAGMIQNCGWFSRLIKKVVVAAVVVVAVAAVASAVVATAGFGLSAVIAAGAVAGAVTGAVAGGIISYSEYGKLDWRWIVGGAVVGGAIGAVVGWGVGGAVMKTTTAQTNQLIRASKNGQLKFSKTVNNYYVSGQRPYCNSNQLVQEIMKTKNPIKDPGSATGLKWQVEGVLSTAKGTTKGVWDLVVDPVTKTVWHLVFKS